MMRRPIAALLLLGLSLSLHAERWSSRIDLSRALNNPSLLHRLTILYTYSDRPEQMLYVYGHGALILQQMPVQRSLWNSLVPTCTAHVGEDTIGGLINLFIQRRFFDLPQKNFTFLYASDDAATHLRIHQIIVDTRDERAGRVFATGTYAGQIETIPPAFAEIEAAIQDLRDKAFPAGKPCTVAPPVKF